MVNREGIGRYVRELVRGMVFARKDPPIKLFAGTLRPSAYTRDQLGLQGSATQIYRPRVPTRLFRRWLRFRGMGIDEWLGGACVYHQTQWSPLEVRKAAEVSTIFDCIYSLDAQGGPMPGFLPPAAAQRMLEQAQALADRSARILVPSEFVAREVETCLGADPAKVRVIPLGCDHLPPPSKPPEYLPHGVPFLITAARIDRRKNHVLALRVFERLVALGYPHSWVVVGPLGYGYEDFVHALRHSPARHRVRMLRSVEDGDLASLLAAADLLLWPSRQEGFGLPPLEAMANGTPVVTSRNSSLTEICGSAALLVDTDDESGFVEACRKLIEDSEFSRRQVEEGYEHATRFTWRETARRTLAVYQELEQELETGPKT